MGKPSLKSSRCSCLGARVRKLTSETFLRQSGLDSQVSESAKDNATLRNAVLSAILPRMKNYLPAPLASPEVPLELFPVFSKGTRAYKLLLFFGGETKLSQSLRGNNGIWLPIRVALGLSS